MLLQREPETADTLFQFDHRRRNSEPNRRRMKYSSLPLRRAFFYLYIFSTAPTLPRGTRPNTSYHGRRHHSCATPATTANRLSNPSHRRAAHKSWGLRFTILQRPHFTLPRPTAYVMTGRNPIPHRRTVTVRPRRIRAPGAHGRHGPAVGRLRDRSFRQGTSQRPERRQEHQPIPGRAIRRTIALAARLGLDEWVLSRNFFDLEPVRAATGVRKIHGDGSDIITDEA